MNDPTFNLERALRHWRQRYEHHRVYSSEDLDELERHLRDHVASLTESGVDVREAFFLASRHLGEGESAVEDYRKVHSDKTGWTEHLSMELNYRFAMLIRHTRGALRQFRRYPMHSFINLFGLAVGLAVALLVLLFVRHELSYDRHIPEAERIHRLTREMVRPDGSTRLHLGYVAAPFAPALEDLYPEVSTVTRFWDENNVLLSVGDQSLYEDRVYFAEEDFLDLFSIRFLQGNPETALRDPDTAVLTESTARKLFGNAPPLGRTVRLENSVDVEITGIIEDPRPTTHMTYRMIVSFETGDNGNLESWGNNSFLTYFKLPPEATPADLEDKLPRLLESRVGDGSSKSSRLHVQPILDIHLHSHLDAELQPNGDLRYVYMLSVIALLILIIACFNFTNLSTARAQQRAVEIGTRKAAGADRRELLLQFLTESVMFSFAALVFAVVIVFLATPFVSNLLQRTLDFTSLGSAPILIAAFGITLFAGLAAGAYPAIVLSSLRPSTVLRGDVGRKSWRSTLRSSLVVGQFVIAIGLIIGVLVVRGQLELLQNERLGFNKEQLIVLPATPEMRDNFENVRSQLLTHSGIEAVTASRQIPSWRLRDTSWMYYMSGGVRDSVSMSYVRIEPAFFDVYEIPIVAGRAFSTVSAGDSLSGLVLNESAVRTLGWMTPVEAVGQIVNFWGQDAEVIGVAADIHFESLHHSVKPVVFLAVPHHLRVTVRTDGTDLTGTLDFLEQKWRQFRPGYPFEYEFLDDRIERLYEAEARLGRAFTIVSGLAILIACLGLFGLATLITQRRLKEIGIRKVFGASVPSLLGKLTSDFLLLVLIGAVLAVPLSYFLLHRWLEQFASRIQPGPGIFLTATILVILLAAATVGFQVVRAATANPVNCLRQE